MIHKNKNENKVYIELHNTYLLLVVLHDKKGELGLDSKTTQIVPLSNLEFDDGVVNNPSIISRFIKNYVDSQNLKNPGAVVCLRSADGASPSKQKFMTLQIALFVAKAGLPISKIVHGPIVPWNNTSMLKGSIHKKDLISKINLFKLLTPPKHTNPYGWITVSLFFLTSCGAFMVRQYKSKRREAYNLSLTVRKLEKEKSLLPKVTPPTPMLNRLDNGTLLTKLAKSMPENSWLTGLKNNAKTLKISGNTLKNEEIPMLIKELGSLEDLQNVSLAGVETVKKGNFTVFAFTVKGELRGSSNC